jgi:hypothetical protein
VTNPDDPLEKIPVQKYLDNKRQKEISHDGGDYVKLFKDNEKFDIEKVMKPPKEHMDALKEKVMNDAYDRASNDL